MKFYKSIIRFFIPAIILCALPFQNCMDVPRGNDADRKSDKYNNIYSDKTISAFRFVDPDVSGVINEADSTIIVYVLYGTDVTSLAAEFTTNAESVTINGREQRSGITVNDFSEPLYYGVTAMDGSSKEYTVSAEFVIIASFSLSDPALKWEDSAVGTIDHDLKTIFVSIFYYMDITNLITNFNAVGYVSLNSIIQESGITGDDFTDAETDPFVYLIEDDNGVFQEYSVTVTRKDPDVSHLAGSLGGLGCVDGTGSQASFASPYGVTCDLFNVYIADDKTHTIRKIEISTGKVTIFAGSPWQAGDDDGTGTAARFDTPRGITTNGKYLFVSDSGNLAIRKIDISTGVVTTVATLPDIGSLVPTGLSGITTDGGLNLYVCYDDTIQEISIPGGGVTHIAGTINHGWADDANGLTGGISSQFRDPAGITLVGTNLYVCDRLNNQIRLIDLAANYAVATPYGSLASASGVTDATGNTARFSAPGGITTDNEYLYIADSTNNSIRKIDIVSTSLTYGYVATIAGQSTSAGYTDGIGSAARFYYPQGIAANGSFLFIADNIFGTIRAISLFNSMVGTFAGLANEIGNANGTGAEVRFASPQGITTDGTDIYICDKVNCIIRKINILTGLVSTAAGSGATGTDDAPLGLDATFTNPAFITELNGNLYLIDNHAVRKINILTSSVTTFAGVINTSGSNIVTDTVAVADARFNTPLGITTDGTDLYIADTNNYVIRKIVITGESTGNVSTVAGDGTSGYYDGTGTEAIFNCPIGITSDGTNLYITDTYNCTIRKMVISTGVVSTFAGVENDTNSVDGIGTDATFCYPTGITTDRANLYVCEKSNTIRKIVITTGVVTTLAGTINIVGKTDGPASTSLFNFTNDNYTSILFHDKKLYVSDYGNNAIRVITP